VEVEAAAEEEAVVKRAFWGDAYDTYIFDADGVLWTGQRVIPGAPEVINRLISDKRKRVLILTNNSTRTLEELAAKCTALGFKGIHRENIVSAGMVCAHEVAKLKRSAEFSASAHLPVYLLGSAGFARVLADAGIDYVGCGPDLPVDNHDGTFRDDGVDLSQKPFAVVAALDRHLNYVKIMKAANYLLDPAVPFVVTSETLTCPGSVPGVLVPGAGITSTILRALTGRTPIVVGKPHAATWNYICERFQGQGGDRAAAAAEARGNKEEAEYEGEDTKRRCYSWRRQEEGGGGVGTGIGIDPKRTVMIGDRCDMDVRFGNQNGMDTLLVLSGIDRLADVWRYKEEAAAAAESRLQLQDSNKTAGKVGKCGSSANGECFGGISHQKQQQYQNQSEAAFFVPKYILTSLNHLL